MRTAKDPTGQAKNRRRAFNVLKKRLASARRRVLTEFRAIPRTSSRVTVNITETVYDYSVTVETLTGLAGSIAFIMNDELLTAQNAQMPFDWYWKKEIEQPYRQGTIQGVNEMNRAINRAGVSEILLLDELAVERVLFTPGYNDGLAVKYASSWDDITALSNRTAQQVTQVITDGMQAGKTPTQIAADITKRFKVSASSAKRTAFTEVNRAYNDSKFRLGKVAADELGLVSGVLHRSALLSTTRLSHSARHGNVYTAVAELQWWNEGANRINCHCSIDLVLLNAKGEIIVAMRLTRG